jgi:hypothetical protein
MLNLLLNGNTTRVALSNLNFLEDNLNGTRTYQVTSTTPVLLVDVTTSNYINWPEGSFISAPGYTGYVSENYNTAFNEDYNTAILQPHLPQEMRVAV